MSTVRLPQALADGPGGNPPKERERVIETVCFTRDLDRWFVNKREKDKSFWDSYGV